MAAQVNAARGGANDLHKGDRCSARVADMAIGEGNHEEKYLVLEDVAVLKGGGGRGWEVGGEGQVEEKGLPMAITAKHSVF